MLSNETLFYIYVHNTSVNSTEKKTIDDLAFTQKDIFENRKIVTKIPDWFYKLFKDNDEDRERRSLEIH